jgi:hypothetical protein
MSDCNNLGLPWRSYRDDGGNTVIVRDRPRFELLATVYTGRTWSCPVPEMVARLMLAAPALEAACIALIAASHEIPPGPSDLRTALELAIEATDDLMEPQADGSATA